MPTEEFAGRMDAILDMLSAGPPAPGVERVLAAGELEMENGARNRGLGAPLAPSIVDQLATLGRELGITSPDSLGEARLAGVQA